MGSVSLFWVSVAGDWSGASERRGLARRISQLLQDRVRIVSVAEALRLWQELGQEGVWILVLPRALRQQGYSSPIHQQLREALHRCDCIVVSDNEQELLQQLQDVVRAHELQRVDRAAVAQCLLSGGTVRF